LILKLPDGFACKCAAGLPTAGYATTVTLTETDRVALTLAIERVRAQDAGRAQQIDCILADTDRTNVRGCLLPEAGTTTQALADSPLPDSH
jgi:hypothetical protein